MTVIKCPETDQMTVNIIGNQVSDAITSLIPLGISKSMLALSLLKRFRILPRGVTSKNDNGDLRIA